MRRTATKLDCVHSAEKRNLAMKSGPLYLGVLTASAAVWLALYLELAIPLSPSGQQVVSAVRHHASRSLTAGVLTVLVFSPGCHVRSYRASR